MFFTLVCILLWALFAAKAPFDQFGWLMLLGTAYVAGFLDCRIFASSDKDKDRVFPPDAEENQPHDASDIFQN